jgi:hypothetical protein
MSDMDQDPYADEDPESFNEWFPLEHEHLATLPFKLWFCKLKSNEREINELMMDPLSALLGKTEGLLLKPLPGVAENSRVTTTLFGHERTLRLRAILAIASVDEQDSSVSIMTNKQKG